MAMSGSNRSIPTGRTLQILPPASFQDRLLTSVAATQRNVDRDVAAEGTLGQQRDIGTAYEG